MRYIFPFCISLFLYVFLPAQDETNSIITDRPDQTESSSVVPKGILQIETGFIFEKDELYISGYNSENISYNIATTLFRYGLLDWMEVRLGSAFKFENTNVSGWSKSESGISGLLIATKLFLMEEKNLLPKLAFVVNYNLAVGKENFIPEKSEPAFLLAASNSITDWLGIGYNAGAKWINGEQLDIILTASMGISVAENTGLFLEFYGDKQQDTDANIFFDTGFTYLVKNDFQLDVSAGFPVNNQSPDFFISFGASFQIFQN